MAIPNPFRRNDENTRHAWGHTFQWTPDHFTKEQMHPMKSSYDVLAEECLNRLDNISPPTSGELPRNQSTIPKGKEGEEKPKRDLYVLLKEHASEDGKLGELWNEVNTIPDWVVSGLVALILVILLKLDLGLGTNRKRSRGVLQIWRGCIGWSMLPGPINIIQILIQYSTVGISVFTGRHGRS